MMVMRAEIQGEIKAKKNANSSTLETKNTETTSEQASRLANKGS